MPGLIMGFDYGTKRIGVAVGQQLIGTATAIVVIKARDGIPDWNALDALVSEWQPQEVAVERVFMARNADSALKLGQARGAAICAAVEQVPTIAEYSPREVKQAVVGKGSATKEQIQHMVRVLLKLTANLQPDQADALAIAICHSHMRQTLAKIPGARAARGGRFR